MKKLVKESLYTTNEAIKHLRPREFEKLKDVIIQFKTEAQEVCVEDLIIHGRCSYPDAKLHDAMWANDLAEKGIVMIHDGIITLLVDKNEITVLGPNGDIVNYGQKLKKRE